MKLPFVRRKKYEVMKHNLKVLNEERIKLQQKNKNLQIEIMSLEKELEICSRREYCKKPAKKKVSTNKVFNKNRGGNK